MNQLRALLFNILFFGGTAVLAVLLSPVLLGGRRTVPPVSRFWCRYVLAALRASCRLNVSARGLENVPDGPCILVVKHQSALETLALPALLSRANFILKKELTDIPIFGKYLLGAGNIPIDRSAGVSALKTMVRIAAERARHGGRIIIFPEGTRTPPGTSRAFHPGVYALYAGLPELPVIPVALNSGMFWRRRAFTKYGGEVVIEFLSPIEAGLTRKDFMRLIKQKINTASTALEEEAETRFAVTRPLPSPGKPGGEVNPRND